MKKKLNWRLLLFPLSLIYSIISFIRNKLYDFGFFHSSSGILPTIIIGNLTVGGTGKTPMTIFTARLLSKKYKTVILSRGYKRHSQQCLIADHEKSYRDIGDEPKLITQKTGLPIAVCADRHKGLSMIKEKIPQTEVVVLDDAFQYRRLQGNINILLIDFARPIFKDFFLPAGNLRDNIYRIKQADIIVYTKCPTNLTITEANKYVKLTKKSTDNVFFTTVKYLNPVNYFTGEIIKVSELSKYNVIALSGLASNRPFFEFLRRHTNIVRTYNFTDHKQYTFTELKKIFYNFAQLYTEPKIIITTEKDFVKIEEFEIKTEIKQKIFVQPIDIEFLFDSQENYKLKILNKWKKTFW